MRGPQWAVSSTLRRSLTSARAPVHSAATASATNDTAAEAPTAADDPVTVNSCVGIATTLNEPPTAQTAEATHSRRYAAMASGRRSTV
jgi:hypothetical protein